MASSLPAQLWSKIASFCDAGSIRSVSQSEYWVLFLIFGPLEQARQTGQLAYLAAEQERLSQELGRPVVAQFASQ